MTVSSRRGLDLEFHAPRFDRPIALEEQVRLLPPGATCKGLFFNAPIERLRTSAPNHPMLQSREISGRRYVNFFDYPYADFMRVLAATAEAVYPRLPLGEGLRRLGRGVYEALLESQVGKVLIGVLGHDFEAIARVAARGWKVSVSFGSVELETVGARHIRYHFHDFPALLETLQVGVVEGAMSACGVEGEVRVQLRNPGNGSFDVHWSDSHARR